MKIIKVYKECKDKEVKKYNPYHGADGRFASANGMAAGGSFALPKNSKNLKNATIPEGVRVFSGEGAKGKRAVTTSIGTTIENGKVTGGASKPEATETKKPQSLTEKYPLDTSKKVSSPDEYFDKITEGTDWGDSDSFDATYRRMNAYGGEYSSKTHVILDDLGYTDKPMKVSKEEFEEFVKKSPYGEIERGFSSDSGPEQAKKYMADFTDGNATIDTNGVSTNYGEGFYFAYGSGRDKLAIYADATNKVEWPTLKAVLHPDAKVLKYKDNDYESYQESYNARPKRSRNFKLNENNVKDYLGALNKDKLKDGFATYITQNKNRNVYAALKGYDAVEVGENKNLIIVNRSAVIIQE